MYFKKLELLGFKSFAEKTVLHFEPGMTAVVGPNGCGKSNIFDSMRWVLGEQSVKSLRGSKMEDVIFNGTETLPPLGYAEVSLTFSNETKALPIEYDEVTITRRLFRSGESEYLINKTLVRLKDIQELFMGTGIGAESYSLVEQGKIDLILSSRPEDRRLVFDEAAGISKYKSQKKETIRKLEDTEANLLRINDIITEVKRQINSLERQAAKAKRYKEVFENLKGLEGDLAAYQLKQYQDELNKLNEELGILGEQEIKSARMIDQLNKEAGGKEQELIQIETTLRRLQQDFNNADNIIVRNGQQLSFSNERITELESRLAILKKQKEELAVKIAQEEDRINNSRAILDALAKELEEKKSQEAKSNTELEEVSSAINLAQQNIKEAKAKILEFAAVEAGLNNQVKDFTNQLNQAIARKKRLDIERFKTGEELSLTKNKLEAAVKSRDAAWDKFAELKRQNEEFRGQHNAALKEKEKLQADLLALENERNVLESQKEFLADLKLRYENITESSCASVLLDSLSDKNINGIIIKVKAVDDARAQDAELLPGAKYRITGVAKPISLDPQETINKIENLSQGINKLKEDFNQLQKHIEELSAAISGCDKCLRDSEIEYNNQNTQKENIEQYHKKLLDESDIVLSESKETNEELGRLKEKEGFLSEGLEKIKTQGKANQQRIEHWLEDIASKNTLRENILISITQLRTELSAYEEKAANAQDTYRIYKEAYQSAHALFESCLQEEANSLKRISELEEAAAKLEAEIEDAKAQKDTAGKEIAGISGGLINVKDSLKEFQAKIEEHKTGLDAKKTKIYELQMAIQKLKFSQDSIRDRASQVYKISSEDLNTLFKADLNLREVTGQIEQFKEKLDSYGQVNLVAIEEFEELQKRYNFLNTQREDLVKSKESLHEVILKINRTTKKMFLETFEKLAVEFKNYFRLFFGGGDAQLFLIDEQDILESGIEIVCRPPGKKLQNVLLLSGGEKAMSAIALLFAIFKVKPSPFCVLDEIDAALDEANVDRFSRMLMEFTAQSQFIVITHNKKTIANANIMYGITMEKAGISKIVSVKLAEHNTPPQDTDQNSDKEESDAVESLF